LAPGKAQTPSEILGEGRSLWFLRWRQKKETENVMRILRKAEDKQQGRSDTRYFFLVDYHKRIDLPKQDINQK